MATPSPRRRGIAVALFAVIGCMVCCVVPPGAFAHGDTIRVGYASIQPERLVVVAGTTVHFHNANASGAPCTVVFEGETVKSPTLGRAEGWHHTFATPGEFHFQLAEMPSRQGVVVVVAR